jgi:hypothetical protein
MQNLTDFTSERIPTSHLCPRCLGDLNHNEYTFRCNTCDYQETIAENLKRNVTYYINGKTYTKDEVDRLGL